jgi:hypothetical protein
MEPSQAARSNLPSNPAHITSLCEQWAAGTQTSEVLNDTCELPNFQKAWEKWVTALDIWVGENSPTWEAFKEQWEKSPERFSDEHLRFIRFERTIFLGGIRHKHGNDPQWYQQFKRLIYHTAEVGDLDLFRGIGNSMKRKGDGRNYVFEILALWISAALWTCEWKVAARILQRQYPKENPPREADESLRRSCRELGLWHDPNPVITSCDEQGRPILD